MLFQKVNFTGYHLIREHGILGFKRTYIYLRGVKTEINKL